MILHKRRVFFLLLSILFLSHIYGQDARYSQFYANPLYLNPAFAGSSNCPRFSLNFRDQWPAIPGDFISFSGSYDQHIHVLHGGIGVIASADRAGGGIMNSYNVGGIYNFRARVTHTFNLQFALQGSYLSTKINWEDLTTASQYLSDMNIPFEFPQEQPRAQFNAACGFVGYAPNFYFGLAVHHLIPVNLSILPISSEKLKTKWEPKWSAHIGGKITIKQQMRDVNNFGDIFFHPNIIFISQGISQYLHEGFYFNFYPFTIGAWLRHSFTNVDALIVSCGVEYKFFRLGYSYDFNLTKLQGSGGAHEVSLQFVIPCNPDKEPSKKKKRAQYAPLTCPNF